MNAELETRIARIEGLRSRHLSLAERMLEADGSKMFSLDLLALAVINRSLSLCVGFVSLVRAENYLCAASLVRLQLDSCLRFFAANLVDDPHAFSASVLKGIPVRKIKDRSGNPMTDRYLVEALSSKYPWMPGVYRATSGFIHLSERHIFSIIRDLQDDGKLSLFVGDGGEDVPQGLWLEMADGFLAATDAQFEFLEGWVFTKANPELVRAVGVEHEH
jgi:hypothetical protein